MKSNRKAFPFCIILLLFVFSNASTCLASQASSLPSDKIIEIAEGYNYIFICTAIKKTVESNQTRYIFNVTEYLKNPLNSTKICLTVDGGSEIAAYPSTSFFLDIDYILIFDNLIFDKIDKSYEITGRDYLYKLLNSVDSDFLEHFRKIPKIEIKVSTVKLDPPPYTGIEFQSTLIVALGVVLLSIFIVWLLAPNPAD